MITDLPRTAKSLAGLARGARWAYAILALVFAGCLAYQVYLAGMGVFDGATYWGAHLSFVHAFEMLPVLMLVAAIIGRMSIWICLLTVLTFVQIMLQYALAHAGGSVAALHPVNGMLLFFLAAILTYHSVRRAV